MYHVSGCRCISSDGDLFVCGDCSRYDLEMRGREIMKRDTSEQKISHSPNCCCISSEGDLFICGDCSRYNAEARGRRGK